MKKVRAGKFNFSDKSWLTISNNGKDFISRLLTYRAEDRPSAAEALKHPWITELSHMQLDTKIALDALDNLKDFKVEQTLKQATFAFIAS